MIKVLIADDELIVRKGLIATVDWEKFGMEVIADAPNGQKAWVTMVYLTASKPVLHHLTYFIGGELSIVFKRIWSVISANRQEFSRSGVLRQAKGGRSSFSARGKRLAGIHIDIENSEI